jgi:alkanesulfonate monooxygenase SsuD/methylene tetrahydromethanopterin reductase-like flavin-dependent oxidoreductase (luciferase family)
MMSKLQAILYFDMRAPSFATPAPALYAAALEMAEFGDKIGLDGVGLMEHHGSEDGYLPTPFVMGAAVAARTNKLRISLGAVLLPLHDPVKIAEQIGVLDQISGGRLDVIFGAGYVPSEFAAFGVSLHDRAKLLDQGIDLIVRALSGERFETAEGRPVFVRPLPVQSPKDIILVGGAVKASAIRAARFDLGFAPVRAKLFALYEEECAKHGRPPRREHAPAAPLSIHLAEDVDRSWAELMPHALHVARSYAEWAGEENKASPFQGILTEDALRAAGIFAVWTPDELLARAAEIKGHGTLGFMPLLGGLAPELGWKSLHLLEKVLPKLRALQKS